MMISERFKRVVAGLMTLALLTNLISESFRQSYADFNVGLLQEELVLASILQLSSSLSGASPRRTLRQVNSNTRQDDGYWNSSRFSSARQDLLADDAAADDDEPSITSQHDLLLRENNNVNLTTTIAFNESSSNGIMIEQEFNVDTTVLAMIAFGNATRQNHVQRCVRSARARGQWTGRIILVTDSPQNYASLVEQDPLIHIIAPHRQDWEDLPFFQEIKAKYKRFKTRLIDYTLADPRLQDVELILYMDVDIVVCKPIAPWLKKKWDQGREQRMTTPTDMSITYMFETGNGGKAAHSGVILMHTALSNGCMKKWREKMDQSRMTVKRDQNIIRMMRRAGEEKTKCRIDLWPRRELIFPMPKDFYYRRFKQFVHITNTFHAGQTDAMLQKKFLEDALNLTAEERQDPNSLAIVPERF